MAIKQNIRTVATPPRASSLIESMRQIGYSLASALADIIDNSISAGASNIHILADTGDPDIKIGILDDGVGMTESELIEAMRPGSKSPLEDRAPSDLGRFGLGLKTASFSQCRRLTVVSKLNGVSHSACWDLDYVVEKDAWDLELSDDPASVPWAERIGKTGTVVVWEKLDKAVPQYESDGSRQDFIREIDEARTHLELVFHRYLAPQRGRKLLKIILNERPLEPYDPFHSGHPATQAGQVERIRIGDQYVEVQPFTLPQHQKVANDVWERYGGTEGYLKNQGFYVYREQRLIIHGTWFGLARQTELTKLTRVRIDMPNSMDVDWKIDVKKSSAQPPYQVRQRLRTIIEAIGAPSKKIYTTRAMKLFDDNRISFWNRTLVQGEINYRLNESHPVLAHFIAQLQPDQQRDFKRVLEASGAALPIDAIFADLGGDPDKVGGRAISDDALLYAVETTYAALVEANVSEIMEVMRSAEPFRSNWDQVEGILNNKMKEGTLDG